MKNKNLILNPYFLIGLFFLVANDCYLKYEYGNFITGKLSDFAGLLIFPMFIAYLIPNLNKSISLYVGLSFIIWKTPLVTPVIDFVNQSLLIPIHRTIDYTDYMALLILPLSHYLINSYKYNTKSLKWNNLKPFFTYSILIIAFCSFCATSIPRPYEMPKGTVYIGKSYNIKLPKDSVINTIIQLGYNCSYHDKDSVTVIDESYSDYRAMSYYQTDNIIRYYHENNDSIVLDTIANIKYDLIEINPNKTRLTIINITLSEEGSIQDWKELKYLSKQYQSWLKKNLIEKID